MEKGLQGLRGSSFEEIDVLQTGLRILNEGAGVGGIENFREGVYFLVVREKDGVQKAEETRRKKVDVGQEGIAGLTVGKTGRVAIRVDSYESTYNLNVISSAVIDILSHEDIIL